jgi:hypothetical protein
MKRSKFYGSTILSRFSLAVVLAMLRLVQTAPAQDSSPPPGFTALFNGKDLKGWHGMGHVDPRTLSGMTEQERAAKRATDMDQFNQHWRVENGELVNDGNGPYATTDHEYGDIELLLEYKTVPLADSGIYLRANPQVQIWDFTKEGGKWNLGADKGSGGLWNNSAGAPGKDPLVLADKPFGQWNSFRILQIGDKTTVYLNDKLVVDHAAMENFWDRKQPLWAKGPIQLQTHGGEIRWRNVFVREIPIDEANAILQKRDEAGFESIFTGKNFAGWAGPIDEYEIKEGSIACKPGQGGTIYTREVYSDFVVRLEYKLPPGGKSGLAIRYPGSGDAAYVGMCQIQILDDSGDQSKSLDPRQANGAAYGLAAAHRGFLRAAGRWNFEQITVKGPTITVELNGTTILTADLADVTDFLANHPHPGKDRTSGHLGIASHTDPVQFRNIRIRRLP